MKKIIVALSGGIDSSMSLFLLKKGGWQPLGVHFRIPKWRKELEKNENIAKKICQRLAVPYLEIDIREEFKKRIVDYFINEYRQGKTPNPCVFCNLYLKFNKLLALARARKITKIATGHYAKIENGKLMKAKDQSRDQTYYLSFLPQKWFPYLVFPLANYTKEKIYQLATKANFNYWNQKKQSQDFCYLAGSQTEEFLRKELGVKRGLIVDEKQNILGEHSGLHFFTIGQRKGIKLGGGPYFVKGFNLAKNYLIVTKDKKKLFKKELSLFPFNLNVKKIRKPIKVKTKVRYQQPLQPATLYPYPKKLKIIFQKPIFSATSGQICVFYQNNVCLGGGVILK